jgi:hypothetical protein
VAENGATVRRLVALLGVLAACLLFGRQSGVDAQAALPLVRPSDLVHNGTFRVPTGIHAGGQANAGFEYGGTALSYNPHSNSLYMTGHDWDQLTGEISIPALGGTAALLQPLVDVSEGRMFTINDTTTAKKVGGTLVYGDRLIVSFFDFYDGNMTQTTSHASRPLSFAVKGDVAGPFRVGSLNAGFYSGFMALVPAPWQAKLGGPALTGQSGIPVTGRTSLGPSAAVFDPANINGTATSLVFYDLQHPTLGVWNGATALYSGTDTVKGMVFPAGTSSLLFFGTHGTTFCYGPGTASHTLAGTASDNGVDPWCFDPNNSAKGTHGYPYVPYVWAYDANELALVVSGAKQPWDVKPYAVWTLPGLQSPTIGGAAYDPGSRRLFVSEMNADGDNPLIHVFSLAVGAMSIEAPPAPSNVRIVR